MASIKIKPSFTGVPVSPLVNIEDEGVLIVSTQDLNFVGAGVTVTENPLGTAEIDIPGSTIDIEDEGVAIITNPGAINFIGAGVTVTENPLGTAEIDIPGVLLIVTNRQTASYTLVLSDENKLVEMNVGSANNLTVPLNSSVAYSIGTQILISQYGAGQTTIVATGGVTIRSSGGKLKLNAQYSGATLIKIATNEWYLFGDIAS